MFGLLCWHRGRQSGKHILCIHCGVAVEECPCVSWRVPDGSCRACSGSGYVAIVRGNVAKFTEYVSYDEKSI
jgi:excinuclease UvrABC ATPase subunit